MCQDCHIQKLAPLVQVRIESTCGWLENTQGESSVANLSKLRLMSYTYLNLGFVRMEGGFISFRLNFYLAVPDNSIELEIRLRHLHQEFKS